MLLDDNTQKGRNRQLALGGLMSALAIVFLTLTSVVPTLKFTMLVLASISVGVVVVECGVRYATLVYVVVSVISFFTVPYKSLPLLFLFFFGIYPIIKLKFESRFNKWLSYAAKLIWLNLFAFILYIVVSNFLKFVASEIVVMFKNLTEMINTYIGDNSIVILLVGVILLNIAFFVYDFVFSNVMIYYEDKIKSRIKF